MPDVTVETPSGKGMDGENFPVGSWLVRASLRSHVHAFYRFARAADDVADNPQLQPADKLRRLDRMAEVLEGAPGGDAPAAAALRASLTTTGITPAHSHELLDAFRIDATKRRYRDWDDLVAYCRLSAMPVGRHVLDLHGEDRASWLASDPLCASLQVLNHLQDCGPDHRQMDRVYLPLDVLARHGARPEELRAPALSGAMRAALDELLDMTGQLNEAARGLPRTVRDRRLRGETAAILVLAERLTASLRQRDPLAERVKPGKRDFALAMLRGLMAGLRPEPSR